MIKHDSNPDEVLKHMPKNLIKKYVDDFRKSINIDKPYRASMSKKLLIEYWGEHIPTTVIMKYKHEYLENKKNKRMLAKVNKPEKITAKKKLILKQEAEANHLKNKEKAATKIQAAFRAMKAKKEFNEKQNAAIKLQSAIKALKARREYQEQIKNNKKLIFYNNKNENENEFGSTNAYEILGLKPGASHDEIKKKYKKLVIKYHPDKNKAANASTIFKKIQKAYKTLIETADDTELDPESIKNVDDIIKYINKCIDRFNELKAEYELDKENNRSKNLYEKLTYLWNQMTQIYHTQMYKNNIEKPFDEIDYIKGKDRKDTMRLKRLIKQNYYNITQFNLDIAGYMHKLKEGKALDKDDLKPFKKLKLFV